MSQRKMRLGRIVLAMTLFGCAAPRPPVVDGAQSQADGADAAASDAEPGDVDASDVDGRDSESAPDVRIADGSDAMATSCGRCARYADPVFVGRRPAEINELSGLAASGVHAGIYWAHNDSGDSARLFAVRSDGTIVGEYAINGADAADWEDIAVAPCAVGGGSCIVIGDVGDNPSSRSSVDLYRVREPSTLQARGTLDATRFRVRYPSGAMNCEAIVVDRADGRTVLLIEKASSAMLRVVTVDISAAMGSAVTATEHGTIASFAGALVTAADMHPCDRSIIVRTYASAWELRGPSGATLVELSRAVRAEVSTASEVQGEAIAYVHDGRGYITSSEGATAVFRATSCAR